MKITKVKKKRVLEVVDENPRLDIVDVGLGYSIVDKILCNSCFRLKISRKKPFWRFGQKEKCKEFGQRTWQWDLYQ